MSHGAHDNESEEIEMLIAAATILIVKITARRRANAAAAC